MKLLSVQFSGVGTSEPRIENFYSFLTYIQGDSKGKFNILEGDIIVHC
jgi:hypothetical protein